MTLWAISYINKFYIPLEEFPKYAISKTTSRANKRLMILANIVAKTRVYFD